MKAYSNNGLYSRDCLEPQFIAPDEVYFETIPTPEELAAAFPEYTKIMAELAATEYQRLRIAEYPDFKDYLDGVVKNDQAQIQAYINACLAVKAKYPKE